MKKYLLQCIKMLEEEKMVKFNCVQLVVSFHNHQCGLRLYPGNGLVVKYPLDFFVETNSDGTNLYMHEEIRELLDADNILPLLTEVDNKEGLELSVDKNNTSSPQSTLIPRGSNDNIISTINSLKNTGILVNEVCFKSNGSEYKIILQSPEDTIVIPNTTITFNNMELYCIELRELFSELGMNINIVIRF